MHAVGVDEGMSSSTKERNFEIWSCTQPVRCVQDLKMKLASWKACGSLQ